MSIVAFAEFVDGTEVFTICQAALNLIKPILETQPHLEDHDLSSLISF